MWPFHQVMLNREPLPTRFVSKNELKATDLSFLSHPIARLAAGHQA
jgi:hypothetical protein